MNRAEALNYTQTFQDELSTIADPSVQGKYEVLTSQTPDYQQARTALLGEVAIGLQTLASRTPENVAPASIEATPDAVKPKTEPEYQLTREEIAADAWANDLWRSYNRPIREKNASKQRAAEARRDNRLRKSLAEETPSGQHMAYDPTVLNTAFFKTWLELYGGKPQSTNTKFLELVIDTLGKEVKNHWDSTPAEAINGWVQSAALTENSITGEFAWLNFPHRLLKEYFAGPSTAKQHVTAASNFTDATLEFIPKGDPKSLRYASRVINYETDIIPFNGPFSDMIFAFQNNGFGDLDTYTQAINMRRGAQMMYRFCYGSSPLSITEPNIRSMSTKPSFSQLGQTIYEQYSRQYSPQDIARMRKHVVDYNPANVPWLQEMTETFSPDNEALIPGDDNPLFRPLNDSIFRSSGGLGAKVDEYLGYHFGINISPDEFPAFQAISEVAALPLPDGLMLDVLVPAGISLEDKEDLLYAALSGMRQTMQNGDQAYTRFRDLQQADFRHIRPLIRGTVGVDFLSYPILTQLREQVKADEVITHGLSELALIELPEPVLPEGQDLATALSELTARIQTAPNRFVGKRGIRFPLTDPQLASRGLQHIDMRRVDDDRLQVTLKRHAGKPIVFHATANSLDVLNDGRAVHFTHEAGKLWYLSLSMLGEWMTRDAVETSEGLVEEGHEAPAGVGYFGYLQVDSNGKKYQRSEKQWYACAEEQNRDLDEVSAARIARDPTGKGRNSTYYRERYDERANREPLVVYIDPPAFVPSRS